MARFVVSTAGLLAEFAALNGAVTAGTVALAVVSLILAAAMWWKDLAPIADHLVGLDP